MKIHHSGMALFLFGALALFSCTNQDCFEELTLTIPQSDNTPPTLTWEITDLATNNTTTHSGSAVDISTTPGKNYRVVCKAADPDGGIKMMTFAGPGFTQTCNENGQDVTITTSIIANEMDFSSLLPQALKEWRTEIENMEVMGCGEGTLVSLNMHIFGSVENHHGGQASSTLNFNAGTQP